MPDDLKTLVNDLGRGRPTHLIVAEALRRRIVLGGFEPNEALPPERELARALGIGRATLRIALRQLAEEGLVSTTLGRNGGTVVLDGKRTSRTESARLVEEAESVLQHTLEVRLALEPLAARLAATRADTDEVASLLCLVRERAPTVDSYHTFDSRFHSGVAKASDNPLLLESVERARARLFTWANSLWLNVEGSNLAGVLGMDPETAMEADHGPIAEAIAARDPDEAQAAMVRHLEVSGERFREMLNRM